MIKLYSFLTLIILALISCTPEEENDLREASFADSTTYREYYHPDNSLVNVHSRYTAKIFKNSIQIGDTSYTNNALFYKKNTVGAVWILINSFGKDSLAVVYRSKDSVLIRYKDSLVYKIKFGDDLIVKLIDTLNTPAVDSIYHLLKRPASSVDLDMIDSLNSRLGKYLTYPKWQEIIKKRYF